MANNPLDQEIINVRERPLSNDINLVGSYASQSMRFIMRHLFSRRTSIADALSSPTTGFIGDGFWVRESAPAALTVTLRPGLGWLDVPGDVPIDIDGVSGLNDLERYKPAVLSAAQTLTIAVADPVNPRIDIVEIKLDRRRADSTSRDVLNPATGVFAPDTVEKTLEFSLDGRTGNVTTPVASTAGISVVAGTPGAVPVAPPTTAGYVKIAEILVDALAATITENRIIDYRDLLYGPMGHIVGVRTFTDIGANTSSLSALQAPPSMRVAVDYIADDEFDIYILVSPTSPLVGTGVMSPGTKAATVDAVDYVSSTTAFLVDAGLQTLLSTASPALEVAVGQGVLLFECKWETAPIVNMTANVVITLTQL